MVLAHETQSEIMEWTRNRRALRGVVARHIIRYFEQTVSCTLHHDRMWLRLQDGTAAVVLGHLMRQQLPWCCTPS